MLKNIFKKKSKKEDKKKKKNIAKRIGYIAIGILVIILAYVIISDNRKLEELHYGISKIEAEFNTINNTIDHLRKDLPTIKNDSIKKEWQSKIEVLTSNTIELKEKIIDEKEKNHDTVKTLWTHQIEYWGLIVALLVGVVFFNSLEHQVKHKIQEEIAKLTGEELNVIKANYKEFIKHKNLKTDSKIVILNKKGTGFQPDFIKVMKLFNVDVIVNSINVDKLTEVTEDYNIKKIRKADVLIVENQSKTEENKANWDLGGKGEKDKKKTKEQEKNNASFVKIANAICDTTALFYYGKGNFPPVDPDKQSYVSFANAPAQLYINLLNLLKFKNELENI